MKLKRSLNYLAFLCLRLVLLALGVIFFLAILSVAISWQHWRNFSQEALSGKNQLNAALTSLANKDWTGAQEKLAGAETAFLASQAEVNNLRSTWFPAKFGFGQTQLNDLQYLNDSALIITRSANQANTLAINLSAGAFNNQKNFQDLSPEKKAAFLQSLIALEPEFNGLKANLDLALINLNRIHRFGLLWPLRGQIRTAGERITSGEKLLTESLPIIRLLPAFSGYPEPVNYLIMLQNNDELRPTGGFLGSYALVDIANFGEIKRLEANDTYHLDMPSIGKTKYEPPLPINKYLKVNNWYLRDANWSPDWPQSARQIQEMFKAESLAAGQAEPVLNGVFAITPDFVANLLRITGPITVRGETYAPENMQALLQYNVEVAYKDSQISSWDRKEIINELINELKEKLMALPLSQYPELAARLNESLNRGDVLLYFNAPGQENLALNLGGAGEIKAVSGDYLMVVDANLAAFKSDAVMNKDLTYKLDSDQNRLKASVRLDYHHNGDFDWRTTRYRSYTRLLTPLGSELIDIKGINKDEADFISYDDKDLGKHVFGFFWSIEPGQSKEINLSYYLPDSLAEKLRTNNLYTLYIQRQPGSRINSLSVSLEPGKTVTAASSLNLTGVIKKTGAYWTTNLENSQAFQILTK